jgi:hypothetical protein
MPFAEANVIASASEAIQGMKGGGCGTGSPRRFASRDDE